MVVGPFKQIYKVPPKRTSVPANVKTKKWNVKHIPKGTQIVKDYITPVMLISILASRTRAHYNGFTRTANRESQLFYIDRYFNKRMKHSTSKQEATRTSLWFTLRPLRKFNECSYQNMDVEKEHRRLDFDSEGYAVQQLPSSQWHHGTAKIVEYVKSFSLYRAIFCSLQARSSCK